MIIDSSAIIAILHHEREARAFSLLLESTPAAVSAATILEASIVAGSSRHEDLEQLVADARLTVAPFDHDQARVASAAYARYGKGSGSPARLNFGDCFSYALAVTTGESLLFKGEDFALTDVTPAYVPG